MPLCALFLWPCCQLFCCCYGESQKDTSTPMQVLARFLGFLMFSPRWHTSEAIFSAGSSALDVGLRRMIAAFDSTGLPILLNSCLASAVRWGHLALTVPWVCVLLRMARWDTVAMQSQQLQKVIQSLRAIAAFARSHVHSGAAEHCIDKLSAADPEVTEELPHSCPAMLCSCHWQYPLRSNLLSVILEVEGVCQWLQLPVVAPAVDGVKGTPIFLTHSDLSVVSESVLPSSSWIASLTLSDTAAVNSDEDLVLPPGKSLKNQGPDQGREGAVVLPELASSCVYCRNCLCGAVSSLIHQRSAMLPSSAQTITESRELDECTSLGQVDYLRPGSSEVRSELDVARIIPIPNDIADNLFNLVLFPFHRALLLIMMWGFRKHAHHHASLPCRDLLRFLS